MAPRMDKGSTAKMKIRARSIIARCRNARPLGVVTRDNQGTA
jgi:hypothetical protein